MAFSQEGTIMFFTSITTFLNVNVKSNQNNTAHSTVVYSQWKDKNSNEQSQPMKIVTYDAQVAKQMQELVGSKKLVRLSFGLSAKNISTETYDDKEGNKVNLDRLVITSVRLAQDDVQEDIPM